MQANHCSTAQFRDILVLTLTYDILELEKYLTYIFYLLILQTLDFSRRCKKPGIVNEIILPHTGSRDHFYQCFNFAFAS